MPWQRSKRLEQSENGKEADQQPVAKEETQVSLLQRLLPEQHGPEADELQAGAADETTELARPLVNIQGVPIAEHLNSVLPPSPSDVAAKVQETEPAGISAVSAQSQIRDTSGAEASLLIHANRYARSQTRPVRDPVLRKNPSPHDVERLTDAFSKDVRDLGFLTADCILREIDNACRLRRCAQGKLLNDPSSPEVGNLLKGVLKMLYTVETVLHTAFATQPVVTIADLEAAILQMPAFKQVSKFKEAELGELQKHPEVLRRLRLNEPSLPCLPMPKSFPSFSHEEIIKCLVASLPHRWQHWKNEDSWTLEKGLNIVAQQKGFSDSRLLGVFIQQEHVFRIIISIYKRRQLNHSQALGKAVQTALQQVERASKSNGATHHFDWNLWQQMLVAFSNLQQPEERFEFCQEWTWKAAGSKADTQLEKERREFWRLHCAPLLLATFTLATSKRLPAISAPQKLNYSRADVQSLPDLKWLGMESAKWQQTCSTGKEDPSDFLQPILAELQEFPASEPSLLHALVKAERALVRLSGIRSARELPMSFQEFALVHAALGEAIDSLASGKTIQVVDAMPNVDEAQLAQKLSQMITQSLSQPEESGGHDAHSPDAVRLLKCLGKVEKELCQAYGVQAFAQFGLQDRFSEFLLRHSKMMAASLSHLWVGQTAPAVAKLCSLLQGSCPSPHQVCEQARQHFIGLACDLQPGALPPASEGVRPRFPPREVQVLLARSDLLQRQSRAQGVGMVSAEHKKELMKEAVKAVCEAPMLIDLSEALPQWRTRFEPTLGTLFQFLGSDELATLLLSAGTATQLPPLDVVEVRCGVLMRLSDGSFTTLEAALQAKDARKTAATLMSRLLADGRHAPVQQFEAALRRWFVECHKAEDWDASLLTSEVFLLEAVRVLPREVRDVAGAVLVKAYMHLQRPRKCVVEAAEWNSELVLAARWLGEHCGVVEWSAMPWPASSAIMPARRQITASNLSNVPVGEHRGPDRASQTSLATATVPSTSTPKPPSLSTVSEALQVNHSNEQLCRDIARLKAVDLDNVDPITRAWKRSDHMDETTMSLQKTVRGAVKRLAADLYSTETHFLLELLQNVDDCKFKPGQLPQLRFKIEDNHDEFERITTLHRQLSGLSKGLLVVEYNETGFEEANVRALCDIAQSTKKQMRTYIGAKGIGFKSVFRVTNTPVIHSGPFHFHFDSVALDGLGYLVPFPLPVPPGFGADGTRLVLPLHEAGRFAEVRAHVFEDIQPTLLLFLRNLRAIEVCDKSAGLHKHTSKDVQGNKVTLRTTKRGDGAEMEVKTESWRMHSHQVAVAGDSAEILHTELILAFRFNPIEESRSKPEVQQTFAWLPLRSYGFRFILQADWVVPSSREAIVESNPFNQAVRDAIPRAFAAAAEAVVLEALAAEPGRVAESTESLLLTAAADSDASPEAVKSMLEQFYDLIPVPGDALDFFAATPAAILQELQRVPLVLARMASLDERPARLVMVRPAEAVCSLRPAVATDWSEQHLALLEPLLNATGRYVELSLLPGNLTEALGIPCLDSNLTIDCLTQFHLCTQRPVAADDMDKLHLLLLILASDPSFALRRLDHMPMIPTEDGQLVAPAGAHVYNVGVDFKGVVSGAKILSSAFAAVMHQKVSGFLQRAGVEHADGLHFFKQVLVPFLTGPKPELMELVQCTRAARRFLLRMNLEEELMASLRGAMWVAVDGRHGADERDVVWCSNDQPVHLRQLPEVLRNAYSDRWLCVSDIYWAGQPEGEAWNDFWTAVGLWPAFGVSEGNSAELERLMSSARCEASHGSTLVAQALVAFLAPHGKFYSRYCLKTGEGTVEKEERQGNNVWPKGNTSQGILQLLQTVPWLPAHRGHKLLQVSDAWLADTVSPLEEPFIFAACVGDLHKFWPFLGFRTAPTLKNIEHILRNHSYQNTYSVYACRCLYQRLGQELNSRSAAELDADSAETLEFLRKEEWIFVPEHPRLIAGHRDAFDMKGEQEPRVGKWYRLADVVFKDASRLVDTYSRSVTDAASDFAREASGKRIVGQYYWGPHTLFPANWTGSRYSRQHAEVQELFLSLGVKQCLQWSDYFSILAAVDQHVRRTPEARACQEPHIVCAVVQIFGHLVDEVDRELSEGETSLDNEGGAVFQDEKVSESAAKILRRLRPHLAKSAKLRAFLVNTADFACVPTAAGSWARFGEVFFLDNPALSAWQGDCLKLVAGVDRGLEPLAWEAERLRRVFQSCGLLAEPILRHRARVARWHRGKEAALASALLLAAARWANEEAPSHDLAEAIRVQSKEVEFVEVLSADPEKETDDVAFLPVEEVVAVEPGDVESKRDLPCGLLLCNTKAVVTESVEFVLVRPPLQVENYVGYLQQASGETSPEPGALVGAFADTATQAMATQFAASVVNTVVENSISLAKMQPSEARLPLDKDSVKRKLLKRLQQVAAHLQASPPKRLEPPAVAVERAARTAGYAGAGSAEDLLPPWAPFSTEPVQAEREEGNAAQKWMEAAAIPEEVRDEMHIERDTDEEESQSTTRGGMLSCALKALAPSASADGPPKRMFPATLPLAATGTGPLPGPGPGAGLAERGFTLGNADDEGLERHLRSLRARNQNGEDDKEGEDGEDEEGEDKGSEMVLDAAGRATVAQLAGLSEDEMTEVIGRLGEQAAVEALKARDFDVAWVNSDSETGLPFDLVVRPRSTQPWPFALRQLSKSSANKVPSLSDIEVALAQDTGAALVEVKASLAASGVFDISSAQLAMARRLGNRYWLVLVKQLSKGVGRLHVLQDLDKASRDGRVKLLLLA